MSNSSLNLKNILTDIDEARIVQLRARLDEFYAEDIAEEYDKLNREEAKLLFDVLSYEQGAAVMVELEDHDVKKTFQELSNKQIAKFINEMELDDAADLLALLEDERLIKVLDTVQRPFVLKELMSYDANTCGGIMNPEFISVRADLKINAALRYVRLKAKEIDSQIIYIYVTRKFGELVGVISLRELFLAPDQGLVGDHMSKEIISINEEADQEEAAELISKYHFLAIPVTNKNKQLIGIITIDDVVEVIEEETTQDIYQSSGISVDDEDDTSSTDLVLRSYTKAYKARTPWLLITLLGQYLASTLIAGFDSTIAQIPIAISFMPLLSGLSGNIGNQSTTIIVRAMSTGEIDKSDSTQILIHETLISLCIGLTCALLTSGVSYAVYHNALLSSLIGASLVISMMLAVLLGTVTPMLFERLKIDPATASGPLITTAIDMISFFVYLTLITKFVEALV